MRTCPACRALFTPDDDAGVEGKPPVCPRCGFQLPADAERDNPYAAPAPFHDGDPDDRRVAGIPPTLPGKLAAAVQIYLAHFKILGSVVLFISLPVNLLLTYYAVTTTGPSGRLDVLKLFLIVSIVFSPIPVAGIHYSLGRLITGQSVSVFDALSQAVNNWLRLLFAQLIRLVLVVLGFLALIVPGIYLMAQFALLDPVVVLERPKDPRLRSAQLVRGRTAEILAAIVLSQGLVIGISVIIQSIPRPDGFYGQLFVEWGLHCMLDLIDAVGSVFFFLYYWEASRAPAQAAAPKPPQDHDALI